jgi:putative ABC transport system permease protein
MRTEAGAIIQGPERTVLPGYFEAIGVRPTTGRLFTDTDRVEGESPVVVNTLAAARHFGGNALGQSIRKGDSAPRHLRIVGVVPDLRLRGRDGRMEPEMYVLPEPDTLGHASAITMVVRPHEGASISYEALRRIATSIGPKVLVGRIRPITDVLGQQVATPRRRTILLGLLGGFGLALTLVGIFSMTAYVVARRTREIGIRMAFGAAPRDVVRQVVRDTMWPVLIGLSVGLGAAFYATRLVATFLFQTTPHDPGTFLGVVAVVSAGAVLAAWLPARRAARVEPVIALRPE